MHMWPVWCHKIWFYKREDSTLQNQMKQPFLCHFHQLIYSPVCIWQLANLRKCHPPRRGLQSASFIKFVNRQKKTWKIGTDSSQKCRTDRPIGPAAETSRQLNLQAQRSSELRPDARAKPQSASRSTRHATETYAKAGVTDVVFFCKLEIAVAIWNKFGGSSVAIFIQTFICRKS